MVASSAVKCYRFLMKHLPLEFAKEALKYDSETGLIVWRERPIHHFKSERAQKSFNSKFAGKPAGGLERHGYVVIGLNDWVYKGHRIAWLITHGEMPQFELDHINGDRSDNRLCNLRHVEHGDNLRNCKRPKNNRSGHVGVIWHRGGRKWMAYVTARGERHHLGLHDTIEAAVSARSKAQRELGFHTNHGRAG